MTLDILRGPGLWIPLGPANRIYELCLRRKQLLESKDKASSQPHYRQIEALPQPEAHAGPGIEGERIQPRLSVNKAEARREHDQEIIRQRKAVKEAAVALKSGKTGAKADNSLKEHPEDLRKRIESLKT